MKGENMILEKLHATADQIHVGILQLERLERYGYETSRPRIWASAERRRIRLEQAGIRINRVIRAARHNGFRRAFLRARELSTLYGRSTASGALWGLAAKRIRHAAISEGFHV